MLITTIAMLALLKQGGPISGRTLVFSYDFSKQKLSSKDWTFNNGPVYNNERETYTSDNTYYQNGALVIEARKEAGKITSARLQSVKSWKYVYVETIAHAPIGRGTWPAIWMLNDRLRHTGQPDYVGWPKCGEMDILESVGFDPKTTHFSLHSGAFNFMQKNQRTFVAPVDDPNAFHKFGMDWRPDKITFFLDDKPMYTVTKTDSSVDSWPFTDPFYLIMNLAIGGDWGGQKGIDDSIFPSKFEVKTIKVYQ